MQNKFDAIIWDYNGTLIDDVNAALASVNDMLVKRNMPEITLEQYYSYIDTPIIKFYEHIFDLNVVTFETIVKEFSSGYYKHISKNPLMKNADILLNCAKERKIKQILLSASNQAQICDTLSRLKVTDYFDVISGADNDNADSKLKRGLKVIEQMGIAPQNTVVIGDTLHDYKFAQSINAKCILTTKGHQGRKQFANTDAVIIDDLKEAMEYIF